MESSKRKRPEPDNREKQVENKRRRHSIDRSTWECRCCAKLPSKDARNKRRNALDGHLGLTESPRRTTLTPEQRSHIMWAISGGKFCELDHFSNNPRKFCLIKVSLTLRDPDRQRLLKVEGLFCDSIAGEKRFISCGRFIGNMSLIILTARDV